MPFVEGSEVSIPSFRRRITCLAWEVVEKKPPEPGESKKAVIWDSVFR